MFYASCIFEEKKYLKPPKIEKKGNSFFYIVSFRAYFVHLCLFIFSSRFPKIRAEVIQRIQKTGGNKMIVPAYYEDLHTHHLGTTPNRAYFIPASTRMDDLVEHREHSDRFQLLNGDWKFKYFDSVHDLTDEFYTAEYDATDWNTIPVPSVWQNHGYDRHQYTNIRYPFPADPPFVPYENPCGAYLYDFVYESNADAPKAYLNFEGVDSCFYCF